MPLQRSNRDQLSGHFFHARRLAAAVSRFSFGRGVGGAFLVAGVGLIALGLVWADRIIDRLVT